MLESIIWSCSHHRLYRDIDVIFLVVVFSTNGPKNAT